MLPVYFVRLNRLNLVGNYVEMLYKVAAEHHGDGNITGVATASNQNPPDARWEARVETMSWYWRFLSLGFLGIRGLFFQKVTLPRQKVLNMG